MPRRRITPPQKVAPTTRTTIYKMSFTEKEEILSLIHINQELRERVYNNYSVAIASLLHQFQDRTFTNEIRFNSMFFQLLTKSKSSLEALLSTAGVDFQQVLNGSQIAMPMQFIDNANFKFLIYNFLGSINRIVDPDYQTSQISSSDLQTLWREIPTSWALFNSTHDSSLIRYISYYISPLSRTQAEALTAIPTALSTLFSLPLGKMIYSYCLALFEDPNNRIISAHTDCLENYEGLTKEHFIDKKNILVADQKRLESIASRSEVVVVASSAILIVSIIYIFIQTGFSFGITNASFIFIFFRHINKLLDAIYEGLHASMKEVILNDTKKHLDMALKDYLKAPVELNITNKTKNSYFILNIKSHRDFTHETIREVLIKSLKCFGVNVKSYDIATMIIAGDCKIDEVIANKINIHIAKSFSYLEMRNKLKEQIESIATHAKINHPKINPTFNREQHPIYTIELVFSDYYQDKLSLEDFRRAIPNADIIFEFPKVIIMGHQPSLDKNINPLITLIKKIHTNHIKTIETPTYHVNASTSSHHFLQKAGVGFSIEPASTSSNAVENERLSVVPASTISYKLKKEDEGKGVLVYDGESKAFFMNSLEIDLATEVVNENGVMPGGFKKAKGEFGGFKYKVLSDVKTYCLKLFSGARINFEKSGEKIKVLNNAGLEVDAPVWRPQLAYKK